MELETFDELIQIQVEIADQILGVENEIAYYEQLEREMMLKRQRELPKIVLGCKGEETETEFAILYIQGKLQQKRALFDHLSNAFKNRSAEFLYTFQKN